MPSSVELWPAISPPLGTSIFSATFNEELSWVLPPGVVCIIADIPVSVGFAPLDAEELPGSGLWIAAQTPTLLTVPSSTPRLFLDADGELVYVTAFPVSGDANKFPYASMTAPEAVGVYTYPNSTAEVYDLQITGSAEVLLTPTELVWVNFGVAGDDLANMASFPMYPEAPMRFKLTAASTLMGLVGLTNGTMRMSFIGQVL